MVDVQKLFSELSLHDLFKCREVLNIVIERALIEDKATTATKDIKEYCHYSQDYVPKSSPLYDTVQADIESFKFKELDLPDNHTASKWLCDLDEPYTWNSAKLGKSYVNKAHKMSEFQGVFRETAAQSALSCVYPLRVLYFVFRERHYRVHVGSVHVKLSSMNGFL